MGSQTDQCLAHAHTMPGDEDPCCLMDLGVVAGNRFQRSRQDTGRSVGLDGKNEVGERVGPDNGFGVLDGREWPGRLG